MHDPKSMFLARAMASIALLSLYMPIFVIALPAAEPMVTPLAKLTKRANGANIVGYYLNETAWDTRTCVGGYFSTIGDLAGCCDISDCNFITACSAEEIFYQNGASTSCGQACGTGTIYHTVGDSDPLHLYNCQGNWAVTLTTPAATDASSTTGTSSPQGGSANSMTSAVSSTASSGDSNSGNGTSNSGGGGGSSHAGAIAGGVVGGVVALALAAVAIVYILKRKHTNRASASAGGVESYRSPSMQQKEHVLGAPAAATHDRPEDIKSGSQYINPEGPQEMDAGHMPAPQELDSANYAK